MNLDQQPFTDFSKLSVGDIFNQTIVPIFQDLDENADRIAAGRAAQDQQLFEGSREISDLTMALARPRSEVPVMQDGLDVDYDAPISLTATAPVNNLVTPSNMPTKGGYKLSNYGYDSDSSPDYNSNVRRVGHAENPLKDGVSAALTKSLAKKYGLKTGDYFEAVTADGQVLRRRYDDTVPTTYKGKPLPETVDLYERNGSNKFSGRIMEIRPIKK